MKAKRFIFQLFFCVVIALCFIICACNTPSEMEEEKNSDISMFVVVESSGDFKVVYHRETKVMYVKTCVDYGCTFTVMVDADGKPLLWEG